MNKPLLEDKDFLTVIETAEFFGLSRRKLFRLVEEGNLPFMAMYGTRKLIIIPGKARSEGGVSKWQAEVKEETQSIEYYIRESR